MKKQNLLAVAVLAVFLLILSAVTAYLLYLTVSEGVLVRKSTPYLLMFLWMGACWGASIGTLTAVILKGIRGRKNGKR